MQGLCVRVLPSVQPQWMVNEHGIKKAQARSGREIARATMVALVQGWRARGTAHGKPSRGGHNFEPGDSCVDGVELRALRSILGAEDLVIVRECVELGLYKRYSGSMLFAEEDDTDAAHTTQLRCGTPCILALKCGTCVTLEPKCGTLPNMGSVPMIRIISPRSM